MTNASRIIYLASLSLLVLGVTCSPLHAQRLSPEEAYNEAMEALGNQEHTEAFDKLDYAASEGFANAQYQLSSFYRLGVVVEANPNRANALLEAAADQGHPRAALQLSFQELNEVSFESGLQEYQLGNYDEAYARFKSGADHGHAPSMSLLASMYLQRLGIDESMGSDATTGAAMFWLGKASERGHALSQYALGRLYLQTYEDTNQAFRFYRMAAEQGLPEAQEALAWMYVDGNGVPQDYQRAFALARSAANQGYGQAQMMLGGMYTDGVGVDRDLVKAHMWYNLASAQGVEGVANLRDGLAGHMTTSQVAEAQRLAREWEPSE